MRDESENNRRNAERLPARLEAEFKVGHRVGRGVTFDLSEWGVFIETPTRAPEGSDIFVRVHLGPGEPVVKAVGKVRRSTSAREANGRPGMAVEFVRIYSDEARALRRFLGASFQREISETDFGRDTSGSGFKFIFDPEGTATIPSPGFPTTSWSEVESKLEAFERTARQSAATESAEHLSDERTLRELEFSAPPARPGRLLLWIALLALALSAGWFALTRLEIVS